MTYIIMLGIHSYYMIEEDVNKYVREESVVYDGSIPSVDGDGDEDEGLSLW